MAARPVAFEAARAPDRCRAGELQHSRRKVCARRHAECLRHSSTGRRLTARIERHTQRYVGSVPCCVQAAPTVLWPMVKAFGHPAGFSVADTMEVVADEVLVCERRANAVLRRRRVHPARLHTARAQPVLHRSTVNADGADVVRERGKDETF